MTLPERVQADYEGMNLTTGPHPMKLLRAKLPEIWRAIDLSQARPKSIVRLPAMSFAGSGRAQRRDLSSSVWKMKPASRMRS